MITIRERAEALAQELSGYVLPEVVVDDIEHAITEAVLAERERAAKVAEGLNATGERFIRFDPSGARHYEIVDIAAAIREGDTNADGGRGR